MTPDVAIRPLLAPTDPEPVERLNADSAGPVFLLCEHAGRAIPAALGDLGISADVLNSHRGWDIGAEDVARGLAKKLGSPLVIQRYSRLVIDTNRPPYSPMAIPTVSDREEIPGNCGLSEDAKKDRIQSIFDPLDRAITETLICLPRRAAFSIHSFTPALDGVERQWHAGFLSRKSLSTANALIASIRRVAPSLSLAVNEPYEIDDTTDWFIPRHAEELGLPHCLIEIRNDQIQSPEGVSFWVDLLDHAITEFMENLA